MKSEHRAVLVIIGIIVGITALLILGTRILNDSSEYTYNYFPFEKQGILWVVTAEKGGQPYTIPFYYHPTELEGIVAEQGAEQVLLRAARETPNTTVFITLDPDLESRAVVAAVEISRITGDRYNLLSLPTRGALTRPPEEQLAETQNPIVTCDNANNETIVIQMSLGPSNLIHREGNCIILEAATNEDTVRVADRLAYMILGIME